MRSLRFGTAQGSYRLDPCGHSDSPFRRFEVHLEDATGDRLLGRAEEHLHGAWRVAVDGGCYVPRADLLLEQVKNRLEDSLFLPGLEAIEADREIDPARRFDRMVEEGLIDSEGRPLHQDDDGVEVPISQLLRATR
ncbi:MAG TPA: hypothetical protein VHH90_05955 [Polyangia bacterium]|nr:hypothetical protein [Polyangia bacterium]